MNYSMIKMMAKKLAYSVKANEYDLSDDDKKSLQYDIKHDSLEDMDLIAKVIRFNTMISLVDNRLTIKRYTQNRKELLSLAASFVDLGYLDLAIDALIAKRPHISVMDGKRGYDVGNYYVYTRAAYKSQLKNSDNGVFEDYKGNYKYVLLSKETIEFSLPTSASLAEIIKYNR